MTDLPTIIHGVRLYISGNLVMAETMSNRRRVALADHPRVAVVRDVSVDNVAEVLGAAATPDAVHINCCITGVAIHRVAVENVLLLAVSTSALLAFAGGDAAHFVLWVRGADEQIFGADPNVTSLAINDSSLAVQALIGMANGTVLQMAVLFGQPDWQAAFCVAPAVPTQIVAVPGGAVVVGDGGTAAARICVRCADRPLQTAPAPFAVRVTASGQRDPWIVRSDGEAWQLGCRDRRVSGAGRGVYAGSAGAIACGQAGLTLWQY